MNTHPIQSTSNLLSSEADRDAALAEQRAEKLARAKQYASKRFGIPEDTVLGFNGGTCYDKVWVTTREVAEKVAAQVKDETVNGGCFHGMSLGGIEAYDGKFEVMC